MVPGGEVKKDEMPSRTGTLTLPEKQRLSVNNECQFYEPVSLDHAAEILW